MVGGAIRGEPLEYLYQVWRDVARLVYPNRQTCGGLSPEELVGFLLYGVNMHSGNNEFVTCWQSGSTRTIPRVSRRDRPAAHLGWPHAPGGPLDACPARAMPRRPVGAERAGAGGDAPVRDAALALLLFPILVKAYDYRFVIPGYAPLVAAGALSAWGLAVKVSSKLPDSRRRGVAQAG